jgi:hypothetical protein
MAHQILDRDRAICWSQGEFVRIGLGVWLVVGRNLHFGHCRKVFPDRLV